MYRISDDIRKFLEKNFFETEPIFDRIERLIDFLVENEVKESFGLYCFLRRLMRIYSYNI